MAPEKPIATEMSYVVTGEAKRVTVEEAIAGKYSPADPQLDVGAPEKDPFLHLYPED